MSPCIKCLCVRAMFVLGMSLLLPGLAPAQAGAGGAPLGNPACSQQVPPGRTPQAPPDQARANLRQGAWHQLSSRRWRHGRPVTGCRGEK